MIIDFFSLNLRDPAVRSKFGGVYQSFFNALNKLGCQVILSKDKPSSQADVLVVPMGGGQEYGSLQATRCFAGPVVLYVPPANEWFDNRLLHGLCKKVLFAYGMDASSFSPKKYAEVGIQYHYLPFASDPTVMKPFYIPRQYDVVFVGSLSHASRRSVFLDPLMKALGSRPVLCIGSGWQNYGIPEQLVAWGPLLNIIYNLGQVCVNIHSASQVQGADRQIDLNNRVFDLAMAGCCQVCDNPEAVRQCFGEDEVVAVREPEEWVERVLFMLDHPVEAESYRQKALQRALNDHTWQQRAAKFLDVAELLYAKWQPDRDWDMVPPVMLVLTEGKRRMKMAFSGFTKR